MRGYFVLASSKTHVMALRQTAHTFRYGAMPGTSLWANHAVPFQVEAGLSSAACFPRTRRNLGGPRGTARSATRSNWRKLMNWKGVMPAITTSFTDDLHVDHSAVRKHCGWLLD